MTLAGVVALVALVALVGAFAVLTAIGERRRGGGLGIVIVAGVFFPLAWIAWYAHDQRESPSSS